MEPVYEQLLARASTLQAQYHSSESTNSSRIVVALAGPPGSGKSTVAAEVVKRLNQRSIHGRAVVLPMDGFHLSRAILSTMPNSEEAFARRGVHWTYDAEGVVQLVRALHETRSNRSIMHLAPAFDHNLKDPIENAIRITNEVDFVIIEGNWLLFDEEPWSDISQIVDETWFIDVDPVLALPRIAKRHIQSGIETCWENAIQRAADNDIVNGDLVKAKLIPPAVLVQSIDH